MGNNTSPPPATSTAREISDGPFAWLSKAAIWRIRESFDESTFLDQAMAVYLTHCELASDAQSSSYTATRRKIAERSGVSVRRVAEVNQRLQKMMLLDWKQNFLEGTKELAPSTYTLMSCLACTTLGTASTRLGTDVFPGNCTVVEQSPEESPKKSPGTKIGFDAVRLANRIISNQDGWSYDNCKVVPDGLKTKPLASVIEPALTRGLSEAAIIKSWQEAVTATHGAAVDGLAQDTTKYCVAMFKAKLAER